MGETWASPEEYFMLEIGVEYERKSKHRAKESEAEDDSSQSSSPQYSLATPVISWEEHFQNGIIAFKAGKYENAVECFDKAIAKCGTCFQLYDSRAAALEKLGKIKQALRDSRKTIDLAPEKCHGYLRSASLFLRLKRYEFATNMVRFGLERVGEGVLGSLPARRLELEELQRKISEAKRTHDIVTPNLHLPGLPVELIAEVFLLSTEMDSTFPIVACCVSRHWRSVALSTPSLWQRVILSHRNPVKKLMLWTKRSKYRITSLQIRDTISWLQLHDALGVCDPSILKSLRSIHCVGDVQVLITMFLGKPNVFQHLDVEDIYLSSTDNSTYCTLLSPFVPQDRMSRARSLYLDNIGVDFSLISSRLCQLRILVVRDGMNSLRLDAICELLSRNSQIEKLILDARFPLLSDHISGTDRIVLSQLSHLELLGPVFAEILLARLSVPSLERFAISRCSVSADQVILALEPSYVTLVELSIKTCYFKEECLAPFLKTMSRLTKLEITHSANNINAVVDAVADTHQVDGQTKLICPALKHVNFSHCTNLNGGPIVRLVKSRLTQSGNGPSQTGAPTRIETVYMDGCPNIDPSLPPWLRTTVSNVSCIYMTKKEAKEIRRY